MAHLQRLNLTAIKDHALAIIFQRTLEFTSLKKKVSENFFKNRTVSYYL